MVRLPTLQTLGIDNSNDVKSWLNYEELDCTYMRDWIMNVSYKRNIYIFALKEYVACWDHLHYWQINNGSHLGKQWMLLESGATDISIPNRVSKLIND